MTGAVAGLLVPGGTRVPDPACIAVSFPGFASGLVGLQASG